MTVDEGKIGFPSPFGRYTLTERLATGGMAEVFKAKITSTHGFEKVVVIKRILPQLAADRTFVAMFIDEAKLTAQLIHPKIVQVIDFGEVKGQYFIALEFIDGFDALALLRASAGKQVRLPMPICIFIAMEVLDALDYAHHAKDGEGRQMQLVHRDISPSNVFIARRGDVKLGDFGIAHAQERESKTQAGTLKGKYGYMSPEQVMGQSLDGRSDVFSVGIVLAEMLMGRRLFSAANDLDVLLMVRDGRLDRLDKYARDLPPGLDLIVRKALARKVNERYQSAAELRDALSDLLFQARMRVAPSDVGRIANDFLDASPDSSARVQEHCKRWEMRAPAPGAADEPGSLRGSAPISGPHSHPVSMGSLGSPPSGPQSGARRSGHTPAPAAPPEEPIDVEMDEPAGAAVEASAKLAEVLAQPLSVVDLDKYEAPSASRRSPVGTAPAPAPPAPAVSATASADLATVSPLRIFCDLAVGQETGLLRFEAPPHTRDLFWSRGIPEALSSTVPSERFGDALVAQGRVRPEAMQAAQSQLGRFGGRLPDALIGLGLLAAGELGQWLAEHTRARIIEAFAQTRGRASFYRGVRPAEPPPALSLDAFEMMGAGVLTLPLEIFRTRFVPMLDQRPTAVTPPRLDPALFRLGPTPQELWAMFDGSRSIRTWLGNFPSPDEQMTFLRTLYLLTETGLAVI